MWQPYKTYEEKARAIISGNRYMVLATCNKHAKPWATPVFYTYDRRYNFYFLSAIDSRHAGNILENSDVAIAIFDSAQDIGGSDGVQLEAAAHAVEKEDLKKVIELYCKRLFPDSEIPATERYNPDEYKEPSEFRFFKAAVTKAYITGVDRRVEIELTRQ